MVSVTPGQPEVRRRGAGQPPGRRVPLQVVIRCASLAGSRSRPQAPVREGKSYSSEVPVSDTPEGMPCSGGPVPAQGADDVDAYYETYVKVLESVNNPEALISMLHRDLTLSAGATDHLWRRV